MDRPIILNAAMVRAVLSGQKTQTRRPIKVQPGADIVDVGYDYHADLWLGNTQEDNDLGYCSSWAERCPFGKDGDRLWVRETWTAAMHEPKGPTDCLYRADDNGGVEDLAEAKWTPSIHMPRWASRITLPLISVRVERVQDISEADVWAEGITVPLAAEVSGKNWADIPTLHDAWREVWVSIYGQSSWDANHWVWVAEWEEAEVAR